jgi:hypothetical protein
MDELTKQVRIDMLRTVVWTVISLAVAVAVVYIGW